MKETTIPSNWDAIARLRAPRPDRATLVLVLFDTLVLLSIVAATISAFFHPERNLIIALATALWPVTSVLTVGYLDECVTRSQSQRKFVAALEWLAAVLGDEKVVDLSATLSPGDLLTTTGCWRAIERLTDRDTMTAALVSAASVDQLGAAEAVLRAARVTGSYQLDPGVVTMLPATLATLENSNWRPDTIKSQVVTGLYQENLTTAA